MSKLTLQETLNHRAQKQRPSKLKSSKYILQKSPCLLSGPPVIYLEELSPDSYKRSSSE